ncbi:ABC transporter ATP-binding protein [Hamadaea sp. NPDC050747]|uniref:ABC transporter ATP-binding protein n=1 Tax=Hamadaea sp. NPDC050747 TaxID=3155789 RepID=UPI0033E5529E
MLLEDVWLRYHRSGPWVLQGIQLETHPGEVVTVQGRNGAGKSTLLQLMAGLLRPGKGRVRGRPPIVGWVPERFPADQPFSAYDYLIAMGEIRGLRASAAAQAATGWIERLGLEPFRDVRLAELSKGTAQKVGLAQALLVPPRLLILDEPWEGLDAAARALVPAIVSEAAASGATVLVSDHRGETARLPGATRWTVADGTVTAVRADPEEQCVVEVVMPAGQVTAFLATLAAQGVRGQVRS